MTIGFDALTDHTGNETADFNFTHTPVGTPRGTILFVTQVGVNTPETITVTYGGVSYAETPSSPHTGIGTGSDNNCSIFCFFLGTSLPTGAQSVAVTKSGSAAVATVCISLTSASVDCVVQDDDASIQSESLANPSATLALGGNDSYCAEYLKSGRNAVSSITPLTNWTADIEVDHGSFVSGWYSYDIIGTVDVTMGWTQNADDATCLGVAITETAGGGGPPLRIRRSMDGGMNQIQGGLQ